MSDTQLRRRYRTLQALLAVPPANETVGDDLNFHCCAIEMEAARRSLDLHAEPTERQRWRWDAFDLLGTALVLALAFAFAWAYLGWPW